MNCGADPTPNHGKSQRTKNSSALSNFQQSKLLGLAEDDTIHFITHAKLEFQQHGSYAAAIEDTFRTVGKSIFMTSFILIAAFSVYIPSS